MLRFKRDPGSNPACGRNFFCLNIKKFWYSCENDNYNDVNRHLFEKNVSTEKNPTISRIELMTSPIPPLFWSTAPLCCFCHWMQLLINIGNLPSTCFFFGEKIFWALMTMCIAARGRGEGFTVYSTYKQVSWHHWDRYPRVSADRENWNWAERHR